MGAFQTVELREGCLRVAGQTLLTGVPETVQVIADPAGVGVFLQATAAEAASTLVLPLGQVARCTRLVGCARIAPFWMQPFTGQRGGEVPVETQFLLLELPNGACAVLLPLLDAPFRACLQGAGEDDLLLVAETGDLTSRGAAVTGLFLAVGEDPYALMADAARSVLARMGSGRLRAEKPLPDFIDLFGWCTWDAFYYTVSHDNVRQGLASFAEGGVSPAFIILDDGWLSSKVQPTGEHTLAAFQANDHFPDGLAATVRMAKEEFHIRRFLVWQTLQGYWGGVDAASFPQYRIQRTPRNFTPVLLELCDWLRNQEPHERVYNLVAPEDIYRFHQDFHRFLRAQGVDGVKVDNQATLEAVATGQGGRVALMRHYHESLDASGQAHFLGRVINCMSCSNDMFYTALNSTVTRTSDDFFPSKPESHGVHLYANALVSFFAGEFIHPDWDMFWSAHPQGTLHAVARVVSGGPIYVSDKVGQHDFALLRKLVCSDGTILRPRAVGRPTRDSLFANPLTADVPLKVFNHNLEAGMVGVFALRHDSKTPCRGTVRPAEVEGLAGTRFAVYTHFSEQLALCAHEEGINLELDPLTCELVTLVPVDGAITPLGLLDKLNSAGAITAKGFTPQGDYAVTLRDGGRFGAWCATAPRDVLVQGQSHSFTYDAASGLLCVEIVARGTCEVRVVLG